MTFDPRAGTIIDVTVTPHDRDGRHPDVVGDYCWQGPYGDPLWFSVWRDDATPITLPGVVAISQRPCDRCGEPWDDADLTYDDDGYASCPACEEADERLAWDEHHAEFDRQYAEAAAWAAHVWDEDTGVDGVPF